MIPFTEVLKSGWLMPLWKNGNGVSRSAHEIRSCYQLAMAIVSRVDEIAMEKKKRILVVDDEPLAFDLISEFLAESNIPFELLTAMNGAKAYELAVTQVPDLVITDWLMPSLNGLELIKKLKSDPVTKDIPVIMTSGVMAPNEEFDKVFNAGAIDYLRKPVDPRELRARVKTALVLDESLKEIRHHRDSIYMKDQFVNFLIDEAPNPIFYQDKWGRFLGCNTGFEKLVGQEKQQIVGRAADEFLPHAFADELDRYFTSLTERGVVHKFDIQLGDGEDGVRHLMLSYVQLGNDSEAVIIGSITDITHVIRSGQVAITQLQSIHNQEKAEIASNVEKLQGELGFKRRELTLYLELLIHSRNVKEKLLEGVNKLQPFLTPEGKSRAFSLVRQLQWELNQEIGLGMEKKFDELHTGLYTTLEKTCPDITKNEKRLCAYLKMNHGASDIAKITDKSLNSVNVGFARLRTKLGLPSNKDLRTFLNELYPAPTST